VNADNSGFQFIFGVSRDPFLGLFDIFTPTPSGVALVGFTIGGKHTLSLRSRRRGGDVLAVRRDVRGSDLRTPRRTPTGPLSATSMCRPIDR
jgi:hypothetical protein